MNDKSAMLEHLKVLCEKHGLKPFDANFNRVRIEVKKTDIANQNYEYSIKIEVDWNLKRKIDEGRTLNKWHYAKLCIGYRICEHNGNQRDIFSAMVKAGLTSEFTSKLNDLCHEMPDYYSIMIDTRPTLSHEIMVQIDEVLRIKDDVGLPNDSRLDIY